MPYTREYYPISQKWLGIWFSQIGTKSKILMPAIFFKHNQTSCVPFVSGLNTQGCTIDHSARFIPEMRRLPAGICT